MKKNILFFVGLVLTVLFPLTAVAVVVDDFEVGPIGTDESEVYSSALSYTITPGMLEVDGSGWLTSHQTGLPTDHVYSGNRDLLLDVVPAPYMARIYLDPDGPGGADDVLTFWQKEVTRVDWYMVSYTFDPPVDLTAGWHDRLVITVTEGDKNELGVTGLPLVRKSAFHKDL